MNSAIGLKICVITAGIKKHKLIIKKKKKKHYKIVLLAKFQLHRLEALNSKALTDSNISHNEFVLLILFWKNFMIWKKESKIPMGNKSLKHT